MITKTIAHAVAKCEECGSWIIYKPAADGFPQMCQKCGCPGNIVWTAKERQMMEQMRNQQGGFTVRMM